MPHFYVVTDCEFDGPIPGKNSMLSFGSVAVSETGEILGDFETVLERLENAESDPVTMEFWRKHPKAWEAATENAQPAAVAIQSFVAWIKSFDAEPIFAAHPVSLDCLWLDYYLKRFTGQPLFEGPWVSNRLFRYAPLCIMSMVAGKTGRDYWSCDVQHYPAEWLGAIEHTHRAIDDARGYANLLSFMLNKG
ncbi:exonuclease domain-containing protein [Agrobacterium tumefaciens]|uniref:exonuclease domain-containing protein n=2 Tax=Agrobacterium TaxID=357 RepID=UPI0012965BE0|nr:MULTISPECIES: exonuclease domain-containing protein [Agrobacterium]MQB10162.1 DNA polymerase III subunit epsilon [Agrobacterium sp. ICMP 6402]NTZ91332.1 DNA polymerase III subunit epsilon [Agrobacterium tumefaciens]